MNVYGFKNFTIKKSGKFMINIIVCFFVLSLIIFSIGIGFANKRVWNFGFVGIVFSVIFCILLAIYGSIHKNDFIPTQEFRIVNVGGDVYIIERKYQEIKTFWDELITTEWRFYSSVNDFDVNAIIEEGQ